MIWRVGSRGKEDRLVWEDDYRSVLAIEVTEYILYYKRPQEDRLVWEDDYRSVLAIEVTEYILYIQKTTGGQAGVGGRLQVSSSYRGYRVHTVHTKDHRRTGWCGRAITNQLTKPFQK
jgi:hypothetical protein